MWFIYVNSVKINYPFENKKIFSFKKDNWLNHWKANEVRKRDVSNYHSSSIYTLTHLKTNLTIKLTPDLRSIVNICL